MYKKWVNYKKTRYITGYDFTLVPVYVFLTKTHRINLTTRSLASKPETDRTGSPVGSSWHSDVEDFSQQRRGRRKRAHPQSTARHRLLFERTNGSRSKAIVAARCTEAQAPLRWGRLPRPQPCCSSWRAPWTTMTPWLSSWRPPRSPWRWRGPRRRRIPQPTVQNALQHNVSIAIIWFGSASNREYKNRHAEFQHFVASPSHIN